VEVYFTRVERTIDINKFLLAGLGLLMVVLVTGCPRDEYIVELRPQGNVIERKVIFYREVGTNSSGSPMYQAFSSNGIVAVTHFYLPAGITRDGERHTVVGTFAGELPADVGGAGSYTNLVTGLGSAGFYVERFRGNDDIVSLTDKRYKAADQLTDLILGWSEVAFGKEPDYQKLRLFLDVDFRQDLKNMALYLSPVWRSGANRASDESDDRSLEEAVVRIGQYLVERGYFTTNRVPDLIRAVEFNRDGDWFPLIQYCIVRKLGVPESKPLPASLVFLANPDAVEQSWDNYLATTKSYQAKIEEWEKEKKSDPQAQKPKPEEIADELLSNIIGLNFFDASNDHLVVNLFLSESPVQTNGKWDETGRCVRWEANLESRTNMDCLPTLCYATWSIPDEDFQKRHFGTVIVSGDGLLQYCLWRSGLDARRANEWETFLAGFKPGKNLNKRLEEFRFSDEPAPSTSNPEPEPSPFIRKILEPNLQAKPAAGAQ
jgi:hypothetical protein